MNFVIFDIEANGLENATKIHCLCYTYKDALGEWISGEITDINEIGPFLERFDKLVGHNIITYDIPTIERICGLKINYGKCIDTLGLTWWYFPNMARPGLEAWGESFGLVKPPIDDWENLPVEVYLYRCAQDVEINKRVFIKLMNKMSRLYGKDGLGKMKEAIDYCSFKMYCLKLQNDKPLVLDTKFTKTVLKRMQHLSQEKRSILISVMPKKAVKKTVSTPNSLYLKSGEVSVAGAKWFDILKSNNLPENYVGSVEVIAKYEDPKPTSHQQVKNWLFSLGWKPATYDYKKNPDGSMRAIPQINDDGKLCESVIALADEREEVEELAGYYALNSRIALLEGFLDNAKEKGGVHYITAEANGFTNTMRLKHKVLVNLPGVTGKRDFKDGEWIRGCLTTTEGRELCGADVSSLEDCTKQHYMWDYDPEFVKEMSSADYDPHISIGLLAGIISEEDAQFYKEFKDTDKDPTRIKGISNQRKQAKVVNFSGVYGVGPPKLALTLRKPLEFAKILHGAYWKKNWAVKKVASNQTVKLLGDEMWLLNPVSGFYYSLRYEKDIFSTLNQGTGVYVFDKWLMNIVEQRPQLSAQFHDELILDIKEGSREECSKLLQDSMDKVNEELKLNVTIKMEAKYGKTYARVH